MTRSIGLAGAIAITWACGALADDETDFETRVRPVLASACVKCHGPKKASNGLRLDSREAILRGGKRGPAMVSGDAAQSLLIQAIKGTHDEIEMPPGEPLEAAAVDAIATWIQRGAHWPRSATLIDAARHWAFEPLRPDESPNADTTWRHPIDRFLGEAQRQHGLRPLPSTEKRSLIRRLSFDLLGLPPAPQDVASFLGDESPDAYARLVDRYLASPQYGERWGRYWMDVVRYADTAGDNADYPIPEARHYRDYIIDAFNHDMPYDQFVREQLAGDLLPETSSGADYADRMVATGFLALSRRYATAPEELWHLTLEDTIDTTGRAFLGMTFRCARCHDHKFDPITQQDYYGVYGIFASTRFPYAGSEEFSTKKLPRTGFIPLVPPAEAAAPIAAHQARIEALKLQLKTLHEFDVRPKQIASWDAELATLTPVIETLERNGQNPAAFRAQRDSLRTRRDTAQQQYQAESGAVQKELITLERTGLPPDMPMAYAVRDGSPHDEHLQLQGDPAKAGGVIPRGSPRFLTNITPDDVPQSSSGRLQLAEWITRPDNPLTARVMINRIWQHHFGRGLVATPSNFGARGEKPSHPELLDWLAARFIASGWSIKAMHRLIVTSDAYCRASDDDSQNAALDPDNRYFWRFDRARLDAEAIRDAMLAVGGQLDLNRPSVHPFPPIAQWGWTQHTAFKEVYASRNRSAYLMTQRLQRHPFLGLFDSPDTNTSTDVRPVSTVPLQALYLMNNAFVTECAGALASQLIGHSTSEAARIDHAIELCWCRAPSESEVERYRDFVSAYASAAKAMGASGDQADVEAWTSFARIVLTANEFFYID